MIPNTNIKNFFPSVRIKNFFPNTRVVSSFVKQAINLNQGTPIGLLLSLTYAQSSLTEYSTGNEVPNVRIV